RQMAAISSWLTQHPEFDRVCVYVELGVCGALEDRPALASMLLDLEDGDCDRELGIEERLEHQVNPPRREDKMPFPTTIEELKAAGYTFENDARCKCGEPIEWWKTPRGKMMPMEVDAA